MPELTPRPVSTGRADFVEVEASPEAGGDDRVRRSARALHTAERTRETGETVRHVSPRMAQGTDGPEGAEGDALLGAVCDEIFDAARELSSFHVWRPTDMVVWDNWRVLHSVSGMAPSAGRCMHRTTIKGDDGLGRFETADPTGE